MPLVVSESSIGFDASQVLTGFDTEAGDGLEQDQDWNCYEPRH